MFQIFCCITFVIWNDGATHASCIILSRQIGISWRIALLSQIVWDYRCRRHVSLFLLLYCYSPNWLLPVGITILFPGESWNRLKIEKNCRRSMYLLDFVFAQISSRHITVNLILCWIVDAIVICIDTIYIDFNTAQIKSILLRSEVLSQIFKSKMAPSNCCQSNLHIILHFVHLNFTKRGK